MLQAESVRDAAFGCDWVGTPIPFQRSLKFIIATANKEFQLTGGKFVPVSNLTTLNVCNYVIKQKISKKKKHLFYFTCASNYGRVGQQISTSVRHITENEI